MAGRPSMVNNAGKLFVALLIFCCSAQARLVLQATDLRGTILNQAQAGHPFKIELILPDTKQLSQIPDIPGLNQLQVEGREQRMQFINNNSSVTYAYRVRASKPGTYSIGPVAVERE